MSAAIPTWSTWREAARVVTLPRYLRSTIRMALIVGTVLFAINQLDVALQGDATIVTWIKVDVTYLVVLSCEVGSAGDGWLASEGGVAAVMVVGVEESVKRAGAGGV